jgi:hypothetical protein
MAFLGVPNTQTFNLGGNMKFLRDSGHAPGTIVVAAATQPRFYEFTTSLDAVVAPEGTKLVIIRSCDITQNFNDGIKKMTGEWCWFVGDDHSFDETILMRLLNHRVDVVVPITPCKTVPWMPCMMHGVPEHPGWHENMPLYHWDEVSDPGLMELPQGDFIGQSGMVVRKPVLDEIGYPWFKCGQLDPGRLQEDLTFCRELQQRGYSVWVDRDIIFDHYFINSITARKHHGKWCPALKCLNGETMVMPNAKPTVALETSYVGKSKIKWARLPNEAEYDAQQAEEYDTTVLRT